MSTPSPSDNTQPQFRLRSPNAPPTFQIDLSQPPRKRYTALCAHYRTELQNLVGIYDDVLTFTPYPRLFAYIAKMALRRVKSSEETEELKGISEASGVSLHLVVAYNTFLDLFSGCVSGGVRVRDAGAGAVGKEEEEREGGIVHFRGLDWEMEPLRDLMVCLEYVREGKVVARAVTYAGYIGVLTGVRKGLSISLNYRPKLDSPSSTLSHRLHQLRMLLGFKASTPSILRSFLLSPQTSTLDEIKAHLENTPTAPCYLTFCSSTQVMVIEKDLHALKSEISDRFLAVTNHDLHMESWTTDEWVTLLKREKVPDVAGVKDILGDSIERKRCVEDLWKGDSEPRALGVRDVRRWLSVWPIRNETTHFVCVMDPNVDGGGLVWVEGYVEPVMPPEEYSEEEGEEGRRSDSVESES